MDNTWDIQRKENRTFDVFQNGELKHKDLQSAGLERQLIANGITAGDYDDVVRQLAEAGKARISVPTPGKFRVGFPSI